MALDLQQQEQQRRRRQQLHTFSEYGERLGVARVNLSTLITHMCTVHTVNCVYNGNESSVLLWR